MKHHLISFSQLEMKAQMRLTHKKEKSEKRAEGKEMKLK